MPFEVPLALVTVRPSRAIAQRRSLPTMTAWNVKIHLVPIVVEPRLPNVRVDPLTTHVIGDDVALHGVAVPPLSWDVIVPGTTEMFAGRDCVIDVTAWLVLPVFHASTL